MKNLLLTIKLTSLVVTAIATTLIAFILIISPAKAGSFQLNDGDLVSSEAEALEGQKSTNIDDLVSASKTESECLTHVDNTELPENEIADLNDQCMDQAY